MQGCRIKVIEGQDPYFVVNNAGDYYGPVMGFSGDKPAMFFLLPNARDVDAKPWERGLRHICFPPHGVTEEPDGTLTVHGSIQALPSGWHGFLEKGSWRRV